MTAFMISLLDDVVTEHSDLQNLEVPRHADLREDTHWQDHHPRGTVHYVGHALVIGLVMSRPAVASVLLLL